MSKPTHSICIADSMDDGDIFLFSFNKTPYTVHIFLFP